MNITDNQGRTVLFVSSCSAKLVKLLIELGGVNAVDKNQQTALRSHCLADVAELLRLIGSVNIVDRDGQSRQTALQLKQAALQSTQGMMHAA